MTSHERDERRRPGDVLANAGPIAYIDGEWFGEDAPVGDLPDIDDPWGALWIDGYGPTGEAASPDNLETMRSLNGVTIDKGLQLSLTAGLFNLLGIEPRQRDRYTARFTDLAIVRVKDVSRLAGPRGEPRIIEALKAGTGSSRPTARWASTDARSAGSNGKLKARLPTGEPAISRSRGATCSWRSASPPLSW